MSTPQAECLGPITMYITEQARGVAMCVALSCMIGVDVRVGHVALATSGQARGPMIRPATQLSRQARSSGDFRFTTVWRSHTLCLFVRIEPSRSALTHDHCTEVASIRNRTPSFSQWWHSTSTSSEELACTRVPMKSLRQQSHEPLPSASAPPRQDSSPMSRASLTTDPVAIGGSTWSTWGL